MMLNFYALQDDPFSPLAHPSRVFASRSQTAALQTLIERLQAGQICTLLLGEPGVGKTCLVHAVLAHSALQHIRLVHLWYPPGSFHETLQMIGWELGLKESTNDTTQLSHALHRALLTEHERGRQVVLVIDEAHTIPVESLASLVRLSHVRALTGAPLLQMLLVGLPVLWRSFSAPPWRPYTPRTIASVTLAPFSDSESQAYIRHRLQQAGAGDGTVFTPGAVRHVVRQARGNPHVINELCTHLLLTGFSVGHKPIPAHMAKEVCTVYNATRSHPRWWRGVTVAASVLAIAGIVGLVPSTFWLDTEQGPHGVVPLTRSLLAGTDVETAQHPATPARTVESPPVSILAARPAPTEAVPSLPVPTESLPLSGQGASLPESPTFQTLPLTSLATARISEAVPPPVFSMQPPTSAPPPVVPTPQGPRLIPTPSVHTTRITSPQPGAQVAQKIAVAGVIAALQPDQHVFVCVQSQAFGRLIYPQGKVRPDPTGQWTVESIYGTSGYRYATFLVITTNPASAALLSAQQSRKYGLRDLPPHTERLGTAVVVMRK